MMLCDEGATRVLLEKELIHMVEVGTLRERRCVAMDRRGEASC